VRHYASVSPGLYDAILNQCVAQTAGCASEPMTMDRKMNTGMDGPSAARPEAGVTDAADAADAAARARKVDRARH
jgi:cytochrome o ubiquinol oxidase subunit 2